MLFFFFFFKQKTAYEMRISDWSSDVCSSDLSGHLPRHLPVLFRTRIAVSSLRMLNFPQARLWIVRWKSPGSFTINWNKFPVLQRSEERRVGKECGSTWRLRLSP